MLQCNQGPPSVLAQNKAGAADTAAVIPLSQFLKGLKTQESGAERLDKHIASASFYHNGLFSRYNFILCGPPLVYEGKRRRCAAIFLPLDRRGWRAGGSGNVADMIY